MSWNKKPEPKPFGIPLDEVELLLGGTNLKPTRDGDSLVVQHEKFTTRITVLPPPPQEAEEHKIRAVVQIKTTMPPEGASVFGSIGGCAMANSFATLGSLIVDGRENYIGSRLTIYQQDNAWPLHLNLIVSATIASAETIVGAVRREFGQEPHRGGICRWAAADFENIERMLAQVSVCTGGGLGVTAEFGLRRGAVAAVAGHEGTALWQMIGDQPHPEYGGGIFCLLQLPHQIPDEAQLHQILNRLNVLEMEPNNLPPHFGAWCTGRLGHNPAYISFIPNTLHRHPSIMENLSAWAIHRAQIADATLASMGVSS